MLTRLMVFYALNLADCVMTLYGIMSGKGQEVNYVMSLALNYPVIFVALKIIIPAVICLYLYTNHAHKYARLTSWIIMVLYSMLFVWNLLVLL